jgi:hypothetical protein
LSFTTWEFFATPKIPLLLVLVLVVNPDIEKGFFGGTGEWMSKPELGWLD